MNCSCICVALFLILVRCASSDQKQEGPPLFTVTHDESAGTISVYRAKDKRLVLMQNAKSGIRPYIHPIMAPDGKGELTEYSPAHHKHQTGLYWGLKQVNGRDYFMNWKEDYWRRVSADVLQEKGPAAKWRTVYHLLDENGNVILTETQQWTLSETSGVLTLDLEWRGEAKVDLTMGKFYVGGLFLRMPWRKEKGGEVINAAGHRNGVAEGQRAIWNDIGIEIDGRADIAHIAIFDHPENKDFPIPWRVDNELGVGPSRQILGDWSIREGDTEVIRYRLLVYTGDFKKAELHQRWREFICPGAE